MSKTVSLLSALLCTFIWGTTFIAQDTGMDDIGPFTFNAVRFFVGFLAIVPLAFLFEVKKFKSEFKLDLKTFVILSFLIGLSLFLGSALQQVALLYTDVANASSRNTDAFCSKFLETIACNRAFVRSVRNYLNVHIVGADEIDKSKGADNSRSIEEESPAVITPSGLLEKILREKH